MHPSAQFPKCCCDLLLFETLSLLGTAAAGGSLPPPVTFSGTRRDTRRHRAYDLPFPIGGHSGTVEVVGVECTGGRSMTISLDFHPYLHVREGSTNTVKCWRIELSPVVLCSACISSRFLPNHIYFLGGHFWSISTFFRMPQKAWRCIWLFF